MELNQFRLVVLQVQSVACIDTQLAELLHHSSFTHAGCYPGGYSSLASSRNDSHHSIQPTGRLPVSPTSVECYLRFR